LSPTADESDEVELENALDRANIDKVFIRSATSPSG
jgi:hypothetical protein